MQLDSLNSPKVRFETIEKKREELNSAASQQSDISGSAPQSPVGQVESMRDEISLVIPEPMAEVLHLSYTSPEKFYEVQQVQPKQTISDVPSKSTRKAGMSEELGL